MSGVAGGQEDQLALFDPGQVQQTWRVRESVRARRLTVRVLPGGRVEIVVPSGTRATTVQHFVMRHRGWIERKVADYRPTGLASPEQLPAEIHFQATAARYEVGYVAGATAPRLQQTSGQLTVSGDITRATLVRHLLQRWLLRAAHDGLVPWLQSMASEHELGVNRVQVRRQRTRWGSCSRAGTVSINACLMFQRPEVVRYLFVHELAHTLHMDHSRNFWRLVETLEPGWRKLDRELAAGWRSVPHWAIG